MAGAWCPERVRRKLAGVLACSQALAMELCTILAVRICGGKVLYDASCLIPENDKCFAGASEGAPWRVTVQ